MAGPGILTEQELLRRYIDLVEGKKPSAPAQPKPEWQFVLTDLFKESLALHAVKYSDLPERIKKFVQVKKDDPLRTMFGKHDRPLRGPLAGFMHCHLHHNTILFYTVEDRMIRLVYVGNHDEIEGPRKRALVRRLEPYLPGM